jgi:branched-chain amino acid transport system permease protein
MSLTLLGQSVISGLLIGGLYGIVAAGLTLVWAVLKVINLAHFSFAFLAAYLSYQLATTFRGDPLLALLITVPLFFGVGVGMQWFFQRFRVHEFQSLLVSFGLVIILENLTTLIWSADYHKLESRYAVASFAVGPFFLPVPELLTFLGAGLIALAATILLRGTYLGMAFRALAQDREVAEAFGVHTRRLGLFLSGLATATAGAAGVFISLIFTLFPSQPYAWMGVVFAVVILGGLGSVGGAFASGLIIGVSEAVTMALTAPGWAPLVSFGILILALLFRPQGLFGR